MAATPNPGSDAARALGCICPVMDNGQGVGFLMDGERQFWITCGCPVHDPVGAACQRFGYTVICQQCGATGISYGADTCEAQPDERCEGFNTIERAAYGTKRTGEQTQ